MIKIEDNSRELYINAWEENTVYTFYRDESIGVQVLYPGIHGAVNESYDLAINGTFMGTYLADKDGSLKFELNYALRDIPDFLSFTMDLVSKETRFMLTGVIKPGVSKPNLMFPVPKEYINIYGPTITGIQGHETRSTVFPPNVIYSLPPYMAIRNVCPIIFESTYDNFYSVYNGNTRNLSTLGQPYTDSFIIDERSQYLMLTDINKKQYNIPIKELDECEEYCIVRWISVFGQLRQHVFKVKTITDSINSSIDIIELSNAIHKEKNTDNSITISVEGLTRYSLWYYQDLLTSKEIHATKIINDSLYNPETAIETLKLDHTLVDVSDSEVVVNPGTQFYDLEMNLTFKQFRRY
jgi:hypothetical protein